MTVSVRHRKGDSRHRQDLGADNSVHRDQGTAGARGRSHDACVYTRGSVRRASGFVLTGYPDIIGLGKSRRLSVWNRNSPARESGLPLARHRNPAVLGHACDVVGGTIGQSLDSTGRLVSTAGDKTTAVHDKEVGHIMGAMKFVHH